MPTVSPDPAVVIPDPDHIRAAIDAADERARLLRRLLRLALRFHLHLTTGNQLALPVPNELKGTGRG